MRDHRSKKPVPDDEESDDSVDSASTDSAPEVRVLLLEHKS